MNTAITSKDIFSIKRATANQKKMLLADHSYQINREKFFNYINNNLIERLKDINKSFEKILVISFSEENSNTICSELLNIYNTATITTALPQDLSEHSGENRFDLVISIMNMHKINQVGMFINDIYNLLEIDGFYMDCFIGGDSLIQLRDYFIKKESEIENKAHQRIHPMIRLDNITSIMQQSPYKLPIIDHELITIKCDNFKKLYKNIKAIGETNCLSSNHPINRKVLEVIDVDNKTNQFPREHHMDIIFISGWKFK